MSSLEKPTQMVELKRRILFRSSSFEKLKCSATYPFQLAGSKFTKESLTHLFEILKQKSRAIFQRALLILSLPASNFFGNIILWLFDVLANLFGYNLISKKTSLICSSDSSDSVQKENQLDLEQLSNDSGIRCKLNDSSIDKTITTRKLIRIDVTTKQRHNLILFVYASISITYLQLLFLAIALNYCIIPMGYVFLVSSLTFIGLVLLKIFYQPMDIEENDNNKNSTTKTVHLLNLHLKTSSTTSGPYIKIHNKTLSKI